MMSNYKPSMVNFFFLSVQTQKLPQVKGRLTGECLSDWNTTGTPKASSSNPPFLCKETQAPCCTLCWIIFCVNRAQVNNSGSPFVLSFLVCVNVLQFVQLCVQDGDVGLGLHQRRPQLLVFLGGDSAKS